MPTISEAIKKNTLRYLAGGQPGQPVPAQPQPVGTPPQDLTIPLPRRGDFTPGLLPVNQSDFADQNRTAGGERSGVFLPQPPPQVSSGKAVAGTTNFGIWNPKATYETGNGVAFNGSLYIANTPNSNEQPNPIPSQVATPSSWTLVGSSSADNVQAGLQYAPVAVGAVNATGEIDLSLPGVLPTGSIAPIISTPFSYTSTSTTITISWSGLNIGLVNGTVISIPDGSQEITGLTASNLYSFFPYYNIASASLNFIQAINVPSAQTLTGVGFLAETAAYISTANSLTNPTGNTTLEAWFYQTGLLNGIVLEANANQTGAPSSTYGFGMEVNTAGEVLGYIDTAESVSSGTRAFQKNTWHHLVFTFTSSTNVGTLYVDGIEVASATLAAPTATTGLYWRICYGYNGNFFTGYLSRVAYYAGVALSATQVLNHYTVMLDAGPSTYDNVVLSDGASNYWHLSETSGVTAADSAGTDTGTYQGSYTLNESAQIGVPVGSPAWAWYNPTAAVVQAQFSQGNYPLSAGALGFTAATTSSGSAGGVLGGWSIPGLPYNLSL